MASIGGGEGDLVSGYLVLLIFSDWFYQYHILNTLYITGIYYKNYIFFVISLNCAYTVSDT